MELRGLKLSRIGRLDASFPSAACVAALSGAGAGAEGTLVCIGIFDMYIDPVVADTARPPFVFVLAGGRGRPQGTRCVGVGDPASRPFLYPLDCKVDDVL
jgi:hypothetical protein